MKHTISISDIILHNKEEANHKLIWQTLHPVTITLSQLKQAIKEGHPFVCCKKKNEWDAQSLIGIDIDHFELARGTYTFKEFIAVLDALGIPPCMVYTTFSNQDRKRERFRLLFQLTEPVTDIKTIWKIVRHLYSIIDNLVPGAPDKNCKRPYGLFYPGKKIILYRPKMFARLDILFETIQELENPQVIIQTTKVWNQVKEFLTKDPFIPSVKFYEPPPRLLIILGYSSPWIINTQLDIKTTLGILKLSLINSKGLCYNIIYQKKIIDIYYNIQCAIEQSKKISESQSISVFQHYHSLLCDLLQHYFTRLNCDISTVKTLCSPWKKQILEAMNVQIIPDHYMVLPSRYVKYANAITDLSAYSHLAKLFQRDPRKLQTLIVVILLARELHLQLKDPTNTTPQYIITYAMIADKLGKKFNKSVNRNTLAEWLKQFHDLQLIHICSQEEIAAGIKDKWHNYKNPTVLQVPYFDQSVLIHAEQLAAQYMPVIKTANDVNYQTVKTILSFLLEKQGWVSRDAFIQCIKTENALDNTDGFTIANAQTYFDKHIKQLQQELNLIKSSCTKKLMARFPGNHKIGLTKIYYRGEK